MGKYRFHSNDQASDYEDDEGIHHQPAEKLGAGQYACARRLRTATGAAGEVVLDPVKLSPIRLREMENKFRFFKTLYPDRKTERFVAEDQSTYRLVVPGSPGVAYSQLNIAGYTKQQHIQLFLSAVLAIEMCHQKGIVIVDFSEDNIFYAEATGRSYLIDGVLSAEKGQPLVSEIFAIKTERDAVSARRAFVRYAPECFSTMAVSATESIDIYALGNVMQHLLRGHFPLLEVVALYHWCQRISPTERPSLSDLKIQLMALLVDKLSVEKKLDAIPILQHLM